MRSLKNLKRIIESMTQNEKRLFRVSALVYKKTNTPKFLQLYDSLIKNGVNKTKTENIAQKELLNKLLQFLRRTKASNTVELKVAKEIIDIQNLFERNLFDIAYKQLVKTKRMCEKFELYEKLIEVLNWEWRMNLIRDIKPAMFKIENEKIACLNKMLKISKLESEIFELEQRYSLEEMMIFQSDCDNQTIAFQKELTNETSDKIRFLILKKHIVFERLSLEKSTNTLALVKELLKVEKKSLNNEVRLRNLIEISITHFMSGKFEDSKEILKDLWRDYKQAVETKNIDLHNPILIKGHEAFILLYKVLGDESKIRELISLSSQLKKIKFSSKDQIFFHKNLCLSYFSISNFRKCYVEAHNALKVIDVSKCLKTHGLHLSVFALISLIELDDYETFIYARKRVNYRVSRAINENDTITAYKKFPIDLLDKFNSKKNDFFQSAGKVALAKDLKKVILKQYQNDLTKVIIFYESIYTWTDSVIKNRKMT